MNTYDLIVTRHAYLLDLLRERGVVDLNTPVLAHATALAVEGKHVIGVLPHHLSSKAASITEIPMRLTMQDREDMQAGDLSLERLREVAGDPVKYTVQRVAYADAGRPRWLSAQAAYKHVEDHGTSFGAGPTSMPHQTVEFRGLPVVFIGDGAEQTMAHLIESRGVWRPQCRGPWLDGYGYAVADEDIVPAAGWVPG